MRCFVDEDITNPETKLALSEKLLTLFQGKKAKHYLFLHDWVFGFLGSKSLRFGRDKKREIHDIFSSIISLEKEIAVSLVREKTYTEIPIGRLLHSLPFEYPDHSENFYRFDRGLWFQVDSSRFELIKKILRDFKIPQKDLKLPGYCIKDTMGETRKEYKELVYNQRAVKYLNTLPNHQAFLIDRLNIRLNKGPDHIFEFGDIFLIKDKKYYIIHVKRVGAGLSHHREQVERSAEYLASNLIKNHQDLFLRAAVADFYREFDMKLDIKTQNKYFFNTDACIKDLLKTSKMISQNHSEKKLCCFKNHIKALMSKNQALEPLFEKHLNEFCVALDTLYNALLAKKININEEEEGKTTYITDFLNGLKSGLEGSDALFLNGVLNIKNQKKVVFVLAVIDERAVDKYISSQTKEFFIDKKWEKKDQKKWEKKYKSQLSKDQKAQENHCLNNSDHPLFKNQDLWGLDRTRMLVQKHGFGFQILVTNEQLTENYDAFGKIKSEDNEDNENEDEIESSTDPLSSFLLNVKTDKKRENYKKIIDDLKKNENKGITTTEASDLLSLKSIGSYLTDLEKEGILRKERRHGRGCKYFLEKEIKKEDDSSQTETKTCSSSTDSSHKQSKKEKNFSENFFNKVPFLKEKIDSSIPQKIRYKEREDTALGLYSEYITCPTTGDGDCFFHSIFTEANESNEDVSIKSAQMREAFWNAIKLDEKFSRHFVPLVYEKYQKLWMKDKKNKIPYHIQQIFKDNDEYDLVRNV